MSHFKEQRRIDAAIAHQNVDELNWALEYTEMRLSLSTMKEHLKHWYKTKKKIKNAMESV